MRTRFLVLGLVAVCAFTLALPVRGTGRGQKSPQPKQVTDIEMTDVWADQCRIWLRVTNKGNTKIDKVLREVVWVDGVIKDSSLTHYVLEPGAVFAHGVGADPGVKVYGLNKTVKAQVDVDNVLAELNETNNAKNVTLSCMLQAEKIPVAAKPDLIVTFAFKQMTRKDPNADGHYIYSAEIEFTVSNQGSGGAGACKILLERDSGSGFAQSGPEISVPAVNAGQSITVMSGPYQHTGAAPTYRATVDSHNAVGETKEDNNTFTKKFPS
jgi:subtilase family serine protease